MAIARVVPLVLTAILAFGTSACIRDLPATDASADTASAVPAMAAPHVSRFDVPLAYDFSDVLKVVERAVPPSFGSLDSLRKIGDNDRKRVAFTIARSRFTMFARGTDVHLRTTLSYSARGQYDPPIGPTLSASCGTGKIQPEIVVELVAPVTLTPDWHLQATTRVETLEPASDRDRDKCLVSVLAIDVTPSVITAARNALTRNLAAIDRRIATVDLTKQATKWWAQIARPIRLTDRAWLVLHPKQLRLRRVTGEGHVLTVHAGLDAFPVIVTGPRPNIVAPPLAPLSHDSGSAGFGVELDGTLDYMTASQDLTTRLREKSVTLAGHVITVRSVVATREPRGRIALAVKFAGAADGTVRFVGTPRYDSVAKEIAVGDLIYDLATNNALLGGYAWLRSDALLAFFREKAQVPVTPLIERSKELVTKGLNRKLGNSLAVTGTVDSMSVVGVYVTPEGLVVRTAVWGKAQMATRPPRGWLR